VPDLTPPLPKRRVTEGGATRYFDRSDPCCVYRLYSEADEVIYIGTSHDPATRLRSHYTRKPWAEEISRYELEWHADRDTAEREERRQVRSFKPRHNVVHTDEHRIRSVAHMAPYVRQRMADRIAAETDAP
jgi:predicted GIY-YIG superfamily endonuclease